MEKYNFRTKFKAGDAVLVMDTNTNDDGRIDTIEFICILDNNEIRYKLHKLDIIISEKNLYPVEIIPAEHNVDKQSKKGIHIVDSQFDTIDIKNIYSAIKEVDKGKITVGDVILKNIINKKAREIKDKMIDRVDKRLKAESNDLIDYGYNNENIRNRYDKLLSMKAKLKKMEIEDFINISKEEFDHSFSCFSFCNIFY